MNSNTIVNVIFVVVVALTLGGLLYKRTKDPEEEEKNTFLYLGLSAFAIGLFVYVRTARVVAPSAPPPMATAGLKSYYAPRPRQACKYEVRN